MEPFYEEMGKITDRFIATHIDSYVTAGQLRYKVSSMTYPEAQAVFDRLSERVKKSKLGQEVYQEIQKLKNGSPGSPAAIFSKKDIDGEMFSLAVEKDDIGMFRHVLRGLKQVGNEFDRSQDISEKYGIHSLPTKILIDREGIIIGRYGGGGESHEKMDEKLKEVFGN